MNLTSMARDRVAVTGLQQASDVDLLQIVVGPGFISPNCRLHELAWLTTAQLQEQGCTALQAAKLAAAFELGRRGAWQKPEKGQRCLSPVTVWNLCRDDAAAERERFLVVLLDVRGRLIAKRQISEGSLTQCPVSPRDVMRAAVAENAHGIVFVHNHPSGDPNPSPDDHDLTERLRAAAEICGVVARDHVIVSASGYYSFVEAGRWGRG